MNLEIQRRKAEVRAKQEPERHRRREQARKARACFWTWPWGHVFDADESATSYSKGWKCAVCGKWVLD